MDYCLLQRCLDWYSPFVSLVSNCVLQPRYQGRYQPQLLINHLQNQHMLVVLPSVQACGGHQNWLLLETQVTETSWMIWGIILLWSLQLGPNLSKWSHAWRWFWIHIVFQTLRCNLSRWSFVASPHSRRTEKRGNPQDFCCTYEWMHKVKNEADARWAKSQSAMDVIYYMLNLSHHVIK